MILVENLVIDYGAFALRGISFEVPRGACGVLMGRTGSGKTSILEAVIGLRRPAAGRIVLAGRDVSGLKPAERGIGYVPQDGALFSTMTVREHLAFALRVRRWRRGALEERVGELARLLAIEHLLDRPPQGLSGGEAQRVALGRALACRPEILCLDEPLSALDEDTREEMYGLLKAVRRQTGVTTLHVTHSRREARRLADRILLLRNGTVVPLRVEELREEDPLGPAAGNDDGEHEAGRDLPSFPARGPMRGVS